MNRFVAAYHLKAGAVVAILFPAIFVFSDPTAAHIVNRFVISFIIILSLWLMNFILVDFKSAQDSRSKYFIGKRLMQICISCFFSLGIYFFVASLFDLSGSLLSQVDGGRSTDVRDWFFLATRIILFNLLIVLIKYLYDTHSERRRIALENEMLKRENISAVHESLKQQVNPHFLFNSLNTLKALIKHKPDQAVIFLNELSSVYRYMLQHMDKNMVTLGEEMDFLRSYLYLLKIRFGDAINADISVPDELLQYSMPPNTLQLLIENAVKHNRLSQQKPLTITIFPHQDYLTIQNNVQEGGVQETSSRIGLSNISTRYRLLKGRDIVIKKTEDVFQVLLPII